MFSPRLATVSFLLLAWGCTRAPGGLPAGSPGELRGGGPPPTGEDVFEGDVTGRALGLVITMDPSCDGMVDCPGLLTGTIWIASATDVQGQQALRVASTHESELLPIVDGAVDVGFRIFLEALVDGPGAEDMGVVANVEDLRLSLDTPVNGILRVLDADGVGSVHVVDGHDPRQVNATLSRIRVVPLPPPALAAEASDHLPGDQVVVTSSTSPWDVHEAYFVSGSIATPAMYRSHGGHFAHAFDLLGHLGIGASATLALEWLDLAGNSSRSEVPIRMLAAEPGERRDELDSLAGYAARGVVTIDRGRIPGASDRVAVSAGGALAFEQEVGPDAAALVIEASAVAREPGAGGRVHVEVFSKSNRAGSDFILGPPRQVLEPMSVPIGWSEPGLVEVTFSSEPELLRFNLRPWEGSRAVIVIRVQGEHGRERRSPPPASAVVLHRISMLPGE